MTLYVDDTLITALAAVPLAEGWVETSGPVQVRERLTAADLGRADVALLSVAEATHLTETHVMDATIAVVLDGLSPIVMRTPVRPDGVEETVVRLLDTGPTADVLIRALLKPYFGISANSFATNDDDPGADTAEVVILDGAAGLTEPESGFQEDLAKGWFVLTGHATVSHIAVIGVEALAHGAETELLALHDAVALGQERRKDVRRIASERWGVIDRDALAEFTNRQRFALTAEDRNSLANLIARGTWGSRFGKRLPVYRDHLDADVRGDEGTIPGE